MEILRAILTSLTSVAVLFVIAKFIGHKQLAELDFFDYITGITIGSIAAELAIESTEVKKPLIALTVYGTVSVVLSLITHKMPRARKFINGTPTILMNDGVIYRKNLKQAKLDLSEFMILCRAQGYFDLNDIATAVFEHNGKLSILPVSTKRPLTPEDLGLVPKSAHISVEVIMDGRIMGDNLKRRGLDEKWLEKKLNEAGYKSAKEIFLGVCDNDNKLTLFPLE